VRSLILVAMMLVGCSTGASGPCRLQAVADLPVTLVHNSIEVKGSVNRSDAWLTIDTGAERTVITTTAVKSFLLAHSQRSRTLLTGVGGTASDADVYADVQLGGANFQQRLAEADIPGISGLVGADMLSDYDVEFDLPHGRFRLWHAPGCGATDLPWVGPRSTMAMEVTGRGQLRVPVLVNGKAVNAMLDSGSGVSLLRTDAAQRLGVTSADMVADTQILVRGIGTGRVGVRLHRFNTLDVGGDRTVAPEIGVGEIQIGSEDMILGLDYLRGHRVWVSYRTGQIFVQ
jgi:predicted aspartyl protease